MLKHIVIFMCFVSIQTLVAETSEESSDTDQINIEEAITEVNKEGSIREDIPETIGVEEDNVAQGQRRKRYFEYGFNTGISSFVPSLPNYSSYVKRDNSQDTGVYGMGALNEGALTVIYKRLQGIADSTRRQYLPPDPPRPAIPIPTFIPFHIYIPQIGCGCESTNTYAPSPASPIPVTPPSNTGNENTNNEKRPTTTIPELPPRINAPNDDEDDGVRPISFTPIPPNRPLNRPVPPVEHGSVQAGAEPMPDNFQGGRFPTVQDAPPTISEPFVPPSVCEGAIFRCCLQFQNNPRSSQANHCFITGGCPDANTYNDPCNPQLVLNIINKYREFYKKRVGN